MQSLKECGIQARGFSFTVNGHTSFYCFLRKILKFLYFRLFYRMKSEVYYNSYRRRSWMGNISECSNRWHRRRWKSLDASYSKSRRMNAFCFFEMLYIANLFLQNDPVRFFKYLMLNKTKISKLFYCVRHFPWNSPKSKLCPILSVLVRPLYLSK